MGPEAHPVDSDEGIVPAEGPSVRRSSVVILIILMVAFGGIMAAGGTALRPLAQDADASKVLTRQLLARGDIPEGTKVRLSRLPGSEKRLAPEGRGVVVQLTPSSQVLERRGGLRMLALRAATEALGRFPGQPLDWVEIDFAILRADGTTESLRTLLDAGSGEGVGDPQPKLPAKLDTGPKS